MSYMQSRLRCNHAYDVFSVMASNQPSQIEEIENTLICSLCLEILKFPKTLPCTHSFCEGCLQTNVEIKTVDGRKGIHCPFCKTFSEYGEFIDIYQLQEILELYWKCKKGVIPPCYMCETEENKAIWTCTDCNIHSSQFQSKFEGNKNHVIKAFQNKGQSPCKLANQIL